MQNCFSTGDEEESGLFITASRFNHACIPNCERFYISRHGLLVITTGRKISQGEELTLSYTSEHYEHGYDKFQQYLNRAWGFTCSCLACQTPRTFKALASITKMDDELIKLGSSGHEMDAFKLGKRLIGIYDELGTCRYLLYNRTYYDMFQMTVTKRSSLKTAKKCAQLALDHWEQLIGGSKKEPDEIKKAKMNAFSPEQHRNYLSLEAWN